MQPQEEPKRRKRELKNLNYSINSIKDKEQKKQEKIVQLGKREAEMIPSFNAFLYKQKTQRNIKFRQSSRFSDFDSQRIPNEAKPIIADCAIFDTLKDLEKRIEKLISDKQTSIKETLMAPPLKIKSLLLLQIYNIHYNQGNEHSILSTVWF